MLREQGIALSDVIRQAIDERYAQLNRTRKAGDIRSIVQRIFQQHPDPAALPPRTYNVHDRKAARAAIVEKLQRRAR
jgi:hypothetical protein